MTTLWQMCADIHTAGINVHIRQKDPEYIPLEEVMDAIEKFSQELQEAGWPINSIDCYPQRWETLDKPGAKR